VENAQFLGNGDCPYSKAGGQNVQVIRAVSGGLMKEAIGDRFHAIFVDTGLMRLNEREQVKETLNKHLGINFLVGGWIPAFLGCLARVTESEAQRKTIGGTFIDLFEIEALRIETEAENLSRAGKFE
jgi:GMP synthase (glutamine-hydrolysing)